MIRYWTNTLMVFAMAGVTATMVACGGGNGEASGADGGELVINGVKVTEVYQTWCSQCHGDDGKLGLSGAKDLTQSVLSHDEKIEVVTNGKGAMIPYKDLLKPEEIEAVVTYIEETLAK